MRELIFEGTSFNVDSFSAYTEKQFIQRGMRPGKQGLYSRYPDELRMKLIKEAFRQIKSFGKPSKRKTGKGQ